MSTGVESAVAEIDLLVCGSGGGTGGGQHQCRSRATPSRVFPWAWVMSRAMFSSSVYSDMNYFPAPGPSSATNCMQNRLYKITGTVFFFILDTGYRLFLPSSCTSLLWLCCSCGCVDVECLVCGFRTYVRYRVLLRFALGLLIEDVISVENRNFEWKLTLNQGCRFFFIKHYRLFFQTTYLF